MPRKLTIEEMQSLAKKRGGKCLSKRYVNKEAKLKWECEKGHRWEASAGTIKHQGSWCQICGYRSAANKTRLGIQEMQSLAKKRGGKCLSKRYVNNKAKLKWECEKGHRWEARVGDVKHHGSWCPECGRRSAASKTRLGIQEMQSLAKKRGGKCLSKRYVNSRTKLEWECAHGHRWKAKPQDVKNLRTWCPDCSGSKKLTIEAMQSLAKKRGGKCLSKRYVNSRTKLEWECAHGHRWKAKPQDVKNLRTWCPDCSGSKKLTIEAMQSLAKKRGGKCLSNRYVNGATKLEWECAHGHRWKAKPETIKHQGSWCPACSSGIGERICRSYFRQIFGVPFRKARPKWLKNSRGNQMELDGYCKELRLAFEHQGEQHYRASFFDQSKEDFSQRQIDDRHKVLLCRERKIRLIRIPALFTLTHLEDLQQLIYTECKKLRVRRPAGMRTKKIKLRSAWAGSRTTNTLDAMKALAKSRGGKCLSIEYLRNSIPLEWQCAKGHRWKATSNNVKDNDSWCPRCADRYVKRRQRLIGKMHELASSRGGKCLSTRYVTRTSSLEWVCSEGHQWKASPRTMGRRKHWCTQCSGIKKLTIEEMQSLAKKRGGKCLSKRYVNSHTRLLWECDQGHQWKAMPSDVKNNGTWCPKCARSRGKA